MPGTWAFDNLVAERKDTLTDREIAHLDEVCAMINPALLGVRNSVVMELTARLLASHVVVAAHEGGCIKCLVGDIVGCALDNAADVALIEFMARRWASRA